MSIWFQENMYVIKWSAKRYETLSKQNLGNSLERLHTRLLQILILTQLEERWLLNVGIVTYNCDNSKSFER